MFKQKKGIVESKIGVNDNPKIGNKETHHKTVTSLKKVTDNIINYHFLLNPNDIVKDHKKDLQDKIYDLLDIINKLNIENKRLKDLNDHLQKHLTEYRVYRNNTKKELIELKLEYKKYQAEKENNIKELNIILRNKDENIIFQFKKYLKNNVKKEYVDLINDITCQSIETTKQIITIKINKTYHGKYDIDILIADWLETLDDSYNDDETDNIINEFIKELELN